MGDRIALATGFTPPGDIMFGSNIALPFLAAIVGATFSTWIYGQDAWVTGAAVGFGVGCAILALIWLLFTLLKRWVE
jgi:hypothetical protein